MKIWEHNTTSKSRPWNGAGRVILALHQLSCRLRHSEAWKSSRRRFTTPLVLWKRELYDVYSNYHQLMFWNLSKPAGNIRNISGNIHWVHYLKTSDQFAAWGIQLYTYILTLRRRRPRTSPSREFSKAWKNSSWFLPTRHFLYHESWKLPQVIKKHKLSLVGRDFLFLIFYSWNLAFSLTEKLSSVCGMITHGIWSPWYQATSSTVVARLVEVQKEASRMWGLDQQFGPIPIF